MEIKYDKIKIGEEEIAYLENDVSSDKVILFIHGNMSSSVCFLNLIKELKDIKIFAIDLRGYGNSTYNKIVASIDDFKNDIKKFILKKDLNNFTIVSWSFGGAITLELANDKEVIDRIKNAVFISPAGYKPFVNHGPDMGNLDLFSDIINFNMGFMGYNVIKGNSFRAISVTNLFNHVIYNVKNPPRDEFKRNVYAALQQRNVDEVANILSKYKYNKGRLKFDSIILHGYDDLVINYIDGKQLARITGSIYERLDNCGHSPLTDRFDTVLKYIKEYAEK